MTADAVLLNPAANHGAGREKWEALTRAEPWLGALPRCELGEGTPLAPDPRLVDFVRGLAEEGRRRFVAAGGDGTVNAAVHALLAAEADLGLSPGTLRLGAIGLGSSNDFHKPVRVRLAGFPARVDFDAAAPRDLPSIQVDGDRRFVFLVNSSVGAVAQGARAVQEAGPFGAWLKRRNVDLAMALYGLRTVAGHRDLSLRIGVDGPVRPIALSSLSVVEIPAFGGSMRYPEAPPPGRLGVWACEGLGRMALVRTLRAIEAGRFEGSWHQDAESVVVEGDAPFWLEADGELVRVRQARYTVRSGGVTLCP